MKTIPLNSWSEFTDQIKALKLEHAAHKAKPHASHFSDLLFRGQSNHHWPLYATLERHVDEFMSCQNYYEGIHRAKAQIETFTDKRWDILDPPAHARRLADMKVMSLNNNIANEYLVYLRHHGFPSPLLDWTKSPYIAAFFAFTGAKPNLSATDEARVAIFVYCEFMGLGKSIDPTRPTITTMGPYVRSHRRHFLQQSDYTMCCRKVGDQLMFANHEDVLGPESTKPQDQVWKFILPSVERTNVLKTLDSHNVNALSLFESNEGLMDTLAWREFHFGK